MDGGAVESPLDVLSRAATMVSAGASQGGQGSAEGVHQSTRGGEGPKDAVGHPNTTAQLYLLVPLSVRTTHRDVAPPSEDAVPLDMTRRARQQQPSQEPPPSRPSVITCAPGRPAPTPPPHGGADDDIDEHFRRSLGSDYQHLFSTKQQQAVAPSSSDSSGLSLQITTGNSVDDHFAKALGDTWQRLQHCHEAHGGQQWQRAEGAPQ